MDVILYNHGGCQNRGCEAIVRSTSALLRARDPGARVTLCSLAPQEDGMLAPDSVARVIAHGVRPLSWDRAVNAVRSRMGAPREEQIARNNMPFLRAARRAGLCVSIGGDTYCYGRPELLLAVNARLRAQGTPTALWGCSVEPELLRGEILDDMRGYRTIVCRESITFEAMRAAGLPAVLGVDPAFFLPQERLPLPEGWREGDTVGVNVSPLILRCAEDGAAVLGSFRALIERILRDTSSAVCLVPHVTWAHDDDREALRRLKEAFAGEPRVFLLPDGLNACQTKGYISRLRLFVGARTHATIAAYSSGVPTLTIGYSVKARGIARDLYGEEAGHLLPVQELRHAQQLLSAYEALEANAARERAYLAGRLPAYTACKDEMMDALVRAGRSMR